MIVTVKISIGGGNQRGSWPLTCPRDSIEGRATGREYRYNFTFR